MTSRSTAASRSERPHVGRRLAAARLQRGLAQATVAQRAGLAPSYLSRLENGRVQPTFQTVMLVLDALGAHVSDVVDPPRSDGRRGPCPVTARGQCLIDLVRARPDPPEYSAREIRLMRSFAAWVEGARPDRIRAMEVLLEDLGAGSTGE